MKNYFVILALIFLVFSFLLSAGSVFAITFGDIQNFFTFILNVGLPHGITGYAVAGSCQGTPSSCGSLSSQTLCSAQIGCSWTSYSCNCGYQQCDSDTKKCPRTCDTCYYCAGTPNSCSLFSNQSSCQAQNGCTWSLPSPTSTTTTTTNPGGASITTTDNKITYFYGDTIHFAFSGFSSNSNVTVSVNYPGIGLGTGFISNSVGSGSGSLELGTNLPQYSGSATLVAYDSNYHNASTTLTLNLLQTTTTTTTSIPNTNGIERDNIDINYGNLTDKFPNPLTNAQYSGLKQGAISFKGNSYNYHEDVNLGNIFFSHDYANNNIQGRETMVAQSGQLAYEYVFDSSIPCESIASTSQDTCTITNPEYINPIKIEMLGKLFVIVGIGSNQIKMLNGNVGTANANSGVSYGSYTIYSNTGNYGAWARIIIKDGSGNTVETKVINQGDSVDFTAEGFTVKVTNVRALQDGTIVGVDVVIGPIGQTTVTYTTTCSVGGTGSSNFNFPGETNWCIQVKSGLFATQGQIAAGDTLQVVYKPSSTQYFKYTGATVKLPLPNNYGEVGFEGWNYNSFTTLTTKVLNQQSVYYSIGGGSTNNTVVPGTTVTGVEVDSDVSGTLVDPTTNTGYTKMAYMFNTTMLNGTWTVYPVMVGFWDSVNNRWGVNLTAPYYQVLNVTTTGLNKLPTSFNFNTTLSYGGGAAAKDQQTLFFNATIPAYADMQTVGGSAAKSLITGFAVIPTYGQSNYNSVACVSTSGSVLPNECGVLLNWVNTSATWSSTQSPQFRLYTTDSAEVKDIQSVQTPSGGGTPVYQDIGQSIQDVINNGGTIISAPASAGSNMESVKLPAQLLQVKAYVGKVGVAGTTSGTYQQIVPVTSSVARLDSEITSSDKASKGLILVGGPCVNTLVASLATASGNATASYPYTCASWPARNFGSLRVIDNAFATGHQVVVVAGTRAADTRLAANVLQQFDTLLAGQTSSNVEVTSLSASGITAVS